ncbi:acyl carrier protein [Tengunoibacter tsumagoiensis]|uniref:Uncharacterized protein n=1 Tax=Tengunoibacter tsumagoiensis TaxID=2014871 RepID=A0A402AA12_9CHLR|nr:acyl carrier protein [Tengunoibacter tsumagoiensis]GCE15795.1 hypothetical protein KTT_56540 [Tengunoibacter tsumagoiensis]
MNTSIEELVAGILEVPLSTITDTTGPTNLKAWSSMKHIRLIVALQETYHVTLAKREIQRLTSVGAVKKALSEKGVAFN